MLGPLDKRIQRTRCEACSKRRIKCQGGPPCAYCQKKQQICVPPTNELSREVIFVTSTPRPGERNPTPLFAKQSTISISPVVPLDQSTLLNKHFFSEFLAGNSFAASVQIDPRTLTSFYDSSPALHCATIAVAALDASRRSTTLTKAQQSCTEVVALKAYRTSCMSLQADLASKDVLDNDASLWSTLFLGLFELMYDVSGDGWLKHILYGTSRMLQSRGPERHLSGAGRSFFLTVRIFEICRALLFADETFLAEERWIGLMDRIWDGEYATEWHPKEDLFNLMIRCASLSSRASNVVKKAADPSFYELSSLLLSQTQEGKDIQTSLYRWYFNFNNWSSPTISDHQSALALIYYHAIVIFLSGIFDYHHHWDSYAAPRITADDVQERVATILKLIEVAMRSTDLSGLLFFVPLRIAGARAKTADERRRIMAMLGDISIRSFIVADAFVLDLNEWWRLTANVESVDLLVS